MMKTRAWESERASKRKILRFIALYFDPLGFLAPLLINWKSFCQSLWTAKIEWDELLSGSLLSQYRQLKNS